MHISVSYVALVLMIQRVTEQAVLSDSRFSLNNTF